jgi:transposase InsO family protein
MGRVIIDLVDFKDYLADNRGMRYLLNCIDSFSQFTWSFALSDKTAAGVEKEITNIFKIFGYPSILQSDNGGEFIEKHLRKTMESKGVKIVNSSPYHPQTNGRVERFNQTVEGQLGKLMQELKTRT